MTREQGPCYSHRCLNLTDTLNDATHEAGTSIPRSEQLPAQVLPMPTSTSFSDPEVPGGSTMTLSADREEGDQDQNRLR